MRGESELRVIEGALCSLTLFWRLNPLFAKHLPERATSIGVRGWLRRIVWIGGLNNHLERLGAVGLADLLGVHDDEILGARSVISHAKKIVLLRLWGRLRKRIAKYAKAIATVVAAGTSLHRSWRCCARRNRRSG